MIYNFSIFKTILDYYIEILLNNNQFVKRTYELNYNKCVFYFNGAINKNILSKLNNYEIITLNTRKYIIILDDVNEDAYKNIKSDVEMIYEQGRHHDISIVVIDQYIKSGKVPPKVRSTSSHLIIRSFDDKIKKEIMEICSFNKYDFDIETIKDMINNFYCVIIDYSNKSKLFYYKSPDTIYTLFNQILTK